MKIATTIVGLALSAIGLFAPVGGTFAQGDAAATAVPDPDAVKRAYIACQDHMHVVDNAQARLHPAAAVKDYDWPSCGKVDDLWKQSGAAKAAADKAAQDLVNSVAGTK